MKIFSSNIWIGVVRSWELPFRSWSQCWGEWTREALGNICQYFWPVSSSFIIKLGCKGEYLMGSFNRCEKHFNPKRCLKNENDTESCSHIWLHSGHLHLILSFDFHSTKNKNHKLQHLTIQRCIQIGCQCSLYLCLSSTYPPQPVETRDKGILPVLPETA